MFIFTKINTDFLVDNLRDLQNLRDPLCMKTTRNHLCKSVKSVGKPFVLIRVGAC